MASAQIAFRPFVNLAGTYSAGLSGLDYGTQAASVGGVSSFGGSGTVGLSGVHSWEHTQLGLDYLGSYSHYANPNVQTTGYRNQSVLFSVTHRFSEHATFALRENAGVYSQPTASPGLPQTAGFDPAATYNPTTDFYDNRTTFASTIANLVYQRSMRLSFNLGGHFNLTDRQLVALYSVTGEGANGDVQYRLSERSTVGAVYTYMHFVYHGTFNATDIHTAAGSYAIRFTPSLELTGFGGISRTEFKFLQTVPIDPVVAALIGLRSGVVIHHGIVMHPDYNVRLSQNFEHGVAYISNSFSITPGNGLFLTSTAQNTMAGYSYTAHRYWSFGITAGYMKASSLSNVVGDYADANGSVSASRQIGRATHVTLAFNGMKYQSSTFSGYNRLTYFASLGLSFAPGDVPLRIW
ncbi:MAG TPA: hypothetical protein VMU19_09990 [Bryobacteraceae bacterium]|nr:hypothetical protein [Bryobacteraceae bacterium]